MNEYRYKYRLHLMYEEMAGKTTTCLRWCLNIQKASWRDSNLSPRLIRKYRVLAHAVPDIRKLSEYEAEQIRIRIEYVAENSHDKSRIGRDMLAELLAELGFAGQAQYVNQLRKIDEF